MREELRVPTQLGKVLGLVVLARLSSVENSEKLAITC